MAYAVTSCTHCGALQAEHIRVTVVSGRVLLACPYVMSAISHDRPMEEQILQFEPET